MESYTRLPARRSGTPDKGALVLLHGFTQTGGSWRPLLPSLLGQGFLVLAPDLPGHGAAAEVAAGMWETARLLVETATAELAGGPARRPAAWAGYSMGGRAALHVALAYPEAVGKLVLISTSAGIEDQAQRAARRQRDEAMAQRVEGGGDEGLPAFVSEWLSQPLFSTLPPQLAGLAERVAANTARGLASSLRLAGAGAQAPLWHRLPELGARGLPVLVIAGELDTTYREHAERMARAIGPSASVVLVPGAGHACHLEQPELVGEEVARFCWGAPSEHEPQGEQRPQG